MVTGTAPTTARRLGPISSTKLFVILSVSASAHPWSGPARCGELATVAVEAGLKLCRPVIFSFPG